MFIYDSVWNQIRDQFTDDEKATLESVVLGRVICPAGASIDIDRLDAGLAQKLTDALAAHNTRAARAGR